MSYIRKMHKFTKKAKIFEQKLEQKFHCAKYVDLARCLITATECGVKNYVTFNLNVTCKLSKGKSSFPFITYNSIDIIHVLPEPMRLERILYVIDDHRTSFLEIKRVPTLLLYNL